MVLEFAEYDNVTCFKDVLFNFYASWTDWQG